MRKYVTLIVTVTYICGCALRPTTQRAQFKSPDEAPRTVAANYHVVADVEPGSLRVRARVDIDYQNITSDTFTGLIIHLKANSQGRDGDLHGQSRIEHLEVDGAPIRLDGDYSEREYVSIPLNSPLAHGERAAISITLSTGWPQSTLGTQDAAASIQFVEWLPRVYGSVAQIRLIAGTIVESADFDVSISIDSGWLMVAPGELLNEKELLGMLPNFDTIITDIIHHPYESDGYRFSRLPSAKGKDCYKWRARANTDFDLMILRGYRLDRGRRGKSVVESYYPAEIAESWQYRVAEEGLKLLEYASEEHSGSLSSPLRIVAIGNARSWFADNIQILPETMKRPKLLPIE